MPKTPEAANCPSSGAPNCPSSGAPNCPSIKATVNSRPAPQPNLPDSSDESEAGICEAMRRGLRERHVREVEESERLLASEMETSNEPVNADSSEEEDEEVSVDEQVFVEAEAGVTRVKTVVVATGEDDASKKCKEAGGAQDSIDEDDEDNDDDDDDSSSSSLDDDHDDDDSDDIGREYQRTVRMKWAHNKAQLAKLGYNDDLETKKTIKRKSAPRSLTPNGPRRRNPVKSSRAMTIYESTGIKERASPLDNEAEGSSEGGVPSASPSDGGGSGSNETINASPSNEPNNASPSNESINLDEQFFFDQHNDECEVCDQPGLLLCCATCNLVSHMHCAGLQEEPLSKWMCAYCLADDNPSEGQLSEYFPPLVPQQRPAITKRSLPTRWNERLILNVREDVQTGLSEALLVEDEDNLPVEDEVVSILCCLID